MTSPGVTVRPIELIDGGHEVNEVWFEDVRVPAENLVGELNAGWDYAKFLLGNERVGVAPVGATKRVLAQAKEYAGDQLADPLTAARFAELENELLALELTALRVVAHSTDGKPHPASSVLKLKGTELQQAVSELVVDLAGPASLASGAGDDSDVPELGAARHPGVPQPAQGVDLRRVQRDPAADHREDDPRALTDSGRRTDMDFTYDEEQQALRRGRARAGRQGVRRLREPPPHGRRGPGLRREALGAGWRRWASSGCRSARRTADRAPARSRSASSPRRWAACWRRSRS